MNNNFEKVVFAIMLQNILVTAMFVGLAILADKWWISLFSFITWQNIKYNFKTGDLETPVVKKKGKSDTDGK